MSATSMPAEDLRGRAIAAGLAATAEAAVIYFLVADVLSWSIGPALKWLVPFVGLYAGATILALRLRSWHVLPGAAAAAGALVGLAVARLGGGGAPAISIAFMLLGLRVVGLARRDWREPAVAAFGVGGMALLPEALIASRGQGALMFALIPLFTVAALGSLAASQWLVGEPLGAGESARSMGSASKIALFGVAACVAAVPILGGSGGLAARAGWLATQIIGGIMQLFLLLITPLVFVLVWLLYWLLARVNVRPSVLKQAFGHSGKHVSRVRHIMSSPSGAGPLRLLGLAAIVLLGYVAFRLARRLVPEPAPKYVLQEPATDVATRPIAVERPWRLLPIRRRELPADSVRRWYAELLLLLEREGLTRTSSQTPAEFLGLVAAEYPGCVSDLEELTRAYEEVRYGRLVMDEGEVRHVAQAYKQVTREIRGS
jgi:Domain of unknown function (DUF4129)